MNRKVLVIDDEQSVRNAFMLALEDTGSDVDTAENGSTGLEKFRNGSYDLVFLDLKMPVMDGATALRRIRELDQSVPVYIVTAFHQEYFAELKEAQRDGINFELLHKPVSGDDIRLVVEAALGGTAAREDKVDG
ncbi:MAG: response regulator [Gammaproteobacteria bacterium]|nr:response regulator [Gammaproteobacteria bacterium]